MLTSVLAEAFTLTATLDVIAVPSALASTLTLIFCDDFPAILTTAISLTLTVSTTPVTFIFNCVSASTLIVPTFPLTSKTKYELAFFI